MPTKKTVKVAASQASAATSILDRAPAGADLLRVRNISTDVLIVPAVDGKTADIILQPQQETIVAGAPWITSKALRSMERTTKDRPAPRLEMEWCDYTLLARELPDIENAPFGKIPEGRLEFQFANQILVQPEKIALEMIDREILSPTTQDVDAVYLRGKFMPILEMVLWAEPQMQDRKKVLAAASTRLKNIKAL